MDNPIHYLRNFPDDDTPHLVTIKREGKLAMNDIIACANQLRRNPEMPDAVKTALAEHIYELAVGNLNVLEVE